jgi:site-specific DNA-methyltransferase (adenine-specific)
VISFSTGPRGEVGRALVSVKSGSVNSSQVRDLKGVLDREKAEIGLFVTLEEASGPMQLEATTAGVYQSALSGREYPRIQLITIRELLEEHRRPDLPVLVLPAYQQAERVEKKAAEQGELFG